MLNIIKSNLRRTLRNPAVWITFLACFVLLGGFIIITRNSETLDGFAGTEYVGAVLTGLLAIVILIISHVVLRSDIDGNMFVPRVTAGNNRTEVYFSEFITVTIIALIFWVIVQGFFLGLQAILEPNDREQLIQIVLYALLGTLSILGICAFITALDLNVKNRFVALGFLIGIILIMVLGLTISDAISEPMLNTFGKAVTHFCPPICFRQYHYEYFNTIVDGHEYHMAYEVFDGYSPSPEGEYDLWEHAVYALIVIIVATVAGLLLFRKKDLK